MISIKLQYSIAQSLVLLINTVCRFEACCNSGVGVMKFPNNNMQKSRFVIKWDWDMPPKLRRIGFLGLRLEALEFRLSVVVSPFTTQIGMVFSLLSEHRAPTQAISCVGVHSLVRGAC